MPSSAQAGILGVWGLRHRSVAWKTGLWGSKVLYSALRPPEAPSLLLGRKGQPRSNCPGSVPARRPPPGREATVPVETQVPVSLPPLFGPGGHGGHLERGEAGFGLRADPSGRAGSGTADLPPAAAPESQAILL